MSEEKFMMTVYIYEYEGQHYTSVEFSGKEVKFPNPPKIILTGDVSAPNGLKALLKRAKTMAADAGIDVDITQ